MQGLRQKNSFLFNACYILASKAAAPLARSWGSPLWQENFEADLITRMLTF
jgi:hypothetical protein